MKVGDLVTLKEWCKNSGRLAHVTEILWYDPNKVMIQYLDESGLKEKPVRAIKANLEVISESR